MSKQPSILPDELRSRKWVRIHITIPDGQVIKFTSTPGKIEEILSNLRYSSAFSMPSEGQIYVVV